MRPLLLVTRPQPLATETAAAASASGFDTLCAPLLAIEDVPFAPPAEAPEALLFTSPQAPPRAAAVGALRRVPAWTVGPRTAEAARAAGFSVVWTGQTDGRAALLAMAASGITHALHPCGAETAPADPPPGLRLERRTVYRARAADRLPVPAAEALAAGRVAAVLLFSPRTAAVFAALADRAGLDRGRIALAVISRAALAAAGPGWREAAVAESPEAASVLAAAAVLAPPSGARAEPAA